MGKGDPFGGVGGGESRVILADRLGAERVLEGSFGATALLTLVLAPAYDSMVLLTIGCLLLAVALGAGTGAVLKLVAEWFPDRVGGVTGVVGAAGGLGGFFPLLVMAAIYEATGGYFVGFALMALVAAGCLLILRAPERSAPAVHTGARKPKDRARTVSSR